MQHTSAPGNPAFLPQGGRGSLDTASIRDVLYTDSENTAVGGSPEWFSHPSFASLVLLRFPTG